MNVLKNCVNAKRHYLLLASLAVWGNDAFSFSESENVVKVGPNPADLLSMLMALGFVVAVIVAIAWFAKKFNLTPGSSNQIKVVSNLSLGGRERVVIIEVQNQQHAIGVSNQSVNYLFEVKDKIPLSQNDGVQVNSKLVQNINKFFGYTPPESAKTNNNKKDQ